MSDITLNRYLILGTAADRVLFTPNPTDQAGIGPGAFTVVIWVESDTGDSYYWDATAVSPNWVILTSGGGAGISQLTGDVTAGPGSGSQAATIANNAVTTAKIINAAVTLAKIANAAANSKWLGSGASGSGAAYTENAFGTGLSISGTTLNLADTAVTPGSYTNTNLTVDQQGRITAASNGSAGAVTRPITAVFDNGASVIASSMKKVYIYVPYACTISAVTIVADQSGSAVFDIKKCARASFPGSLTSIVASAPPTLSSAQQSQDTTLTGWTTSISAGDILEFSVTSGTTVTWASVTLTVS